MVEFNIIETSEDYYADYDKFVEYYNNKSLSVKWIKDELGLSGNKYRAFLERGLEENVIVSRDVKRNPRYYYKNKGQYIITRKIGKDRIYFGQYLCEDDAKWVVERLKECNWNKSQMDRINRRLLDEWKKKEESGL